MSVKMCRYTSQKCEGVLVSSKKVKRKQNEKNMGKNSGLHNLSLYLLGSFR